VQACTGYFQDFNTILTDAFKASTFFIGVSILLIFLCILLFLLFLFIQEIYVYIMCGILQTISTFFMFLGCVIFPHGWDNIMVNRICGDGVGRYNLGQCSMRWAYILAIIGVFDILILTVLAFVLAFRQAGKWNEYAPKADEQSNAGYVVDMPSVMGQSHAGSVIMPHHTMNTSNGGDHYGSQPVYIVNDNGRAPSEFSTSRKRAQTPQPGQQHLN